MKPQKLKRVVLKEELAALTGNMFEALILQQHLYWNERTRDFDQFLQEEIDRAGTSGQPTERLANAVLDGWVYKSAEQLLDELMLEHTISARTLARHIDSVVEKGYLLRRHNPIHKWDRTWQYRLDLLKLITDLQALGFHLDGYAVGDLNRVTEALDKLSNQADPASNQGDGSSNQAGTVADQTRTVTDDSETTTETTSENPIKTTTESLGQIPIFDAENPHLKTIQRSLGCSYQKKQIKKNHQKDQWLKVQNRLAEESNYWFFCG